MKKTTFLLLMSLMLASCIEEYHIQNNRSVNGISELVIQGRIQAGDHTIVYLSRTQPLGSEDDSQSISHAKVLVVGENGYESNLAEYDAEKNYYIINTVNLPINTPYSLKVTLDGETYQSEYMNVLESPAIDSLTYQELDNEAFRGITLHVSTHNDNDASRYYLWTYEEDWEFHAPLDIVGIGEGILNYSQKFYKFSETNTYNYYMFCWKHTESSKIHIYNTTPLNENALKEVELIRIPIDDIRISYIYSILVKQCCLDKKAYEYYTLLKKQTEESSGLFTPMPAEIKGNITCTSNPNIRVHGYILASSITTKRLFVYESDLSMPSEYETECSVWRPGDISPNGWTTLWSTYIDKFGAIATTTNGHYLPGDNPDYLKSKLYLRECVDCRAVKGSTKKRPNFWPNNHE